MRRYLIPLAIISAVIGTIIALPALQAAWHLITANGLYLWVIVALAVILQVVGHALRAKRTKLILDQAALSSDKFQFGALSIGYLFNALLPFRIGEVIRSFIIAKRLRISFLYTLTSVLIERAVDVILLSIIIVIGSVLIGGSLALQVAFFALGALFFAIAIITGAWLLVREDKRLLASIWKTTTWFNVSIKNKLRFKIWTLIFGLQKFFKNKKLVKQYTLYAILSWLFYGLSSGLLAMTILGNLSGIERLISAIAPYVVSIPTWGIRNFGEYSQLALVLPAQDPESVSNFGLLSWVVLVFPMAVLGLFSLAGLRVAMNRKRTIIDSPGFINKLSRQDDISQAFPNFLDSYFSGNQLAVVLHKLETSSNLRLVRYFKGGSDAITVLVLDGKELYVKKIIPKRYKDRLKAQYDWLNKHKNMKYLVGVIREQDMNDFYAIDLEYNPKFIPYFEYLHHNSKKHSLEVLALAWDSLYKKLHKNAEVLKYHPRQRDKFIDKHIWGCVNLAAEAHEDIRAAMVQDTITINGTSYDNLHVIMEKIKSNKKAWQDIATYRESKYVHGDPSIDNILVEPSTNEPLIIDPAPDGNLISGAVFDMGKLLQSFYCGYEFLFRDEDAVEWGSDGSINYRDQRSGRYIEICRYVQERLAPEYLSEEEQRALLFHAGTLLIRRLKHQVHSYPQNALKMYAVGVKTLNDFYEQYELER